MSSAGIRGLLLSLAGLTACAGPVVTRDGRQLPLRSAEFAAYVEQVFRLQNEVLDALAFGLDADPSDAAALRLEDRVLAACAGVNELAVRRRDGAATRPLADARAARSVPECEAAADAAAQALAPTPQ